MCLHKLNMALRLLTPVTGSLTANARGTITTPSAGMQATMPPPPSLSRHTCQCHSLQHHLWACSLDMFFFLFFVSFLTSIAESFSSLSPTCQVLKLPPLHHMIPNPVPPQGHKSPLLPLPHYLQACGHRLFTLRHTQVHCHLHSITAHTTCHDTTPMPSQHGMQARYDANLL